jgi:hypothetical protein
MPDSANIEARLRNDLEIARTRLTVSRTAFQAVIAAVPSGIPHPDGSQKIVNASKEHGAALEALLAAVKRYNGFILRGTVPEDLKE